MRQVTINEDDAERMAMNIRRIVVTAYQAGQLTRFARGMARGKFTLIECYLPARQWVLQGIENEINHYFIRAIQECQ